MDLWATREKGDLFHKVDHRPVRLTSGPMSFNGPQPSADGVWPITRAESYFRGTGKSIMAAAENPATWHRILWLPHLLLML
jgi:hypothetical protein